MGILIFFSIAQLLKNPPAMQETPVRFLGLEDPLEKGIGYPLQYSWASLVAQLIKNLPELWKTWIQSLGWEDPLEKGKATHSSWGHKKSDTTEHFPLSTHIHTSLLFQIFLPI